MVEILGQELQLNFVRRYDQPLMTEKKQTSFEAFAISENAGIAIRIDFDAEYAVEAWLGGVEFG